MKISQSVLDFIAEQLARVTDSPFLIDHHCAVAGGDINNSIQITDSRLSQSYFVKINHRDKKAMFEAEVSGLNEIHNAQTIISPKVILSNVCDEVSFLVLEYLPLSQSGDEYALGQQLAKMHRVTQKVFGFEQDNFIGATKQLNTYQESWLDFWQVCRLQPQFELAYRNGFENQLKPLVAKLIVRLPDFLGDHSPSPSLVHGDLWGGNKAFLQDGSPVIFDPACYYGDREVDIAMTYLFSGFGDGFYRGYDAEWPLPDDYQQRQALYNLYHQLNHLNLFGSSYLSGCVNTMRNLL